MSQENEAATLSPEEQRLRGVAEAPKPEVIPEPQTAEAPKAEPAETDTETPSESGGEADGQPDRKTKPNSLKYWKQRAREAEEREARLAQYKEPPKAAEPPAAPQGKPKLDDFPSYDDYQEALTEWKVDQRLQAKQDEARKHQQTTAQHRYQQDLRAKFMESSDKARERYDDFDDVVGSPSLRVTEQVAMLVGETDDPGEVSYFLAKNPDEVKRLNGLSPARVAIELGRIETRISTKPVNVTKAPPPPAKATGKGAASKPNNAYTPAEWMAKRAAEFGWKGK
jgi:hypothetical protein